MVHTSFLLIYFYEHFSIIALVLQNFLVAAQRSRVEQWYGASSNASWYEVCDITAKFTPRPYKSASPRGVGMG
ncbi:hypothetical protein RHMOL_Rhmol01G0239300 [Rhododendron molle]|uniref:Uncharacterized protein n=1 Tax=Rhododendron molle TaxID=49168 RepID=A0ACC0Q664_RHOML|nr:hypothetical protein RHMOL_Rhmol01G0239300 [Rhododendron molle]